MKKEKVKKIFEILHNQNPNARIELHYTNAFTLLIAVVLSAQATDIQVNKITPPIFEEISTPQDLINKGALQKVPGGGRNTNYEVKMD